MRADPPVLVQHALVQTSADLPMVVPPDGSLSSSKPSLKYATPFFSIRYKKAINAQRPQTAAPAAAAKMIHTMGIPSLSVFVSLLTSVRVTEAVVLTLVTTKPLLPSACMTAASSLSWSMISLLVESAPSVSTTNPTVRLPEVWSRRDCGAERTVILSTLMPNNVAMASAKLPAEKLELSMPPSCISTRMALLLTGTCGATSVTVGKPLSASNVSDDAKSSSAKFETETS
mmetsp:Transcript_52750/g.97635  ORF Transcript_52750/g.97635 Transcript_52750/m.97635 type:complete len:230 (+) Transcript_52750:173-862(+)